ncbi:hypothetical protein ABKN59_011469 [Abortiporus biennis]
MRVHSIPHHGFRDTNTSRMVFSKTIIDGDVVSTSNYSIGLVLGPHMCNIILANAPVFHTYLSCGYWSQGPNLTVKVLILRISYEPITRTSAFSILQNRTFKFTFELVFIWVGFHFPGQVHFSNILDHLLKMQSQALK